MRPSHLPSPHPCHLRSAPSLTVTASNSFVDFNLTIDPVVINPLVSYPLNGWVYYKVEVNAGLANQAFTCA